MLPGTHIKTLSSAAQATIMRLALALLAIYGFEELRFSAKGARSEGAISPN
jgi:hypothetical protein